MKTPRYKKPMNIGFDGRLIRNNTGIGRYTRSLFFEYLRTHKLQRDNFYLFHDTVRATSCNVYHPDSNEALPENVHLVTVPCKRRILWTNWHIPPLLRRYHIDIYHGVCNFELPVRKMCRYIVTIHDLVPLFFPELVPRKHLIFFKLFMKRAAHTADLIITDSEHSKRDIVHYLTVPEEKIRVIYLGCEAQYQKIHNQQAIQDVLTRYNIRRPYLLFVGVIEPKKNLERLVDAFVMLRQESSEGKELQLVIAGGKGWFCEQLYHKVQELRLENYVLFTGFVPDADLPYLYSEAELFVFPSIYEGFGLPVLEAMSYGTPVVTSNVSSLPEIAGDAGVLVDPKSPESISQGIASVLFDDRQKSKMQHAGHLQVRKFSWQRTAEQTYNVYQEVYQMA